MRKPRVVVADDNPDVLLQLVSLLRVEFDVVATAKNGQLTIECVRDYKPDIIVLDLEMPIDAEIIEAAQQAGALGYVLRCA